MINREVAKRMASVFHSLSYPPNDVGMSFLIDTLARQSQTPEHCQAIVDEIVRDPVRDQNGLAHWPDAGLLIRVARSTAPEPDGSVCAMCGGAGWIYQPFMRYDKFAGREIAFEASTPCKCMARNEKHDGKMAAAGGAK